MRTSTLPLLIVMISLPAMTAAAQRSGEDGRRKAEQLPVDKPASSLATTGQRENSHDRSNGKEEATAPKLQTQRIPYSFFSERQDTIVTWLGMAGVLINVRGTVIAIDPLITLAPVDGEPRCEGHYRLTVPLPLESKDVPRLDAVLYTHADGDHFGRLTAQALASRLACRFVATPPVKRRLQDVGVEKARIITARDFASIRLGEAVVEITPALHDWQSENPWRRGDCCGYLIKTPDGTVWHPGDTRLIEEHLSVTGVDVLFFDVAAVNAHLGPAGSAKLAKTCGAKVLVAYHYGTFVLPAGSFGGCDPKDSLPYVKELSATFLQLNPGELLRLPLAATE